jgi:hypothetical protein
MIAEIAYLYKLWNINFMGKPEEQSKARNLVHVLFLRAAGDDGDSKKTKSWLKKQLLKDNPLSDVPQLRQELLNALDEVYEKIMSGNPGMEKDIGLVNTYGRCLFIINETLDKIPTPAPE